MSDDVGAWKFGTKTPGEGDEPVGGPALSEEVHLLVVDIDTVKTVLLDESSNGLTKLGGVLAETLRGVGSTKDRDHELHTSTGVARLEPLLVAVALGSELLSVISDAKLDRPEGEVEDVEAGDVPVRGSTVRLASDVLVTVENETRSGNAVNIGSREARVEHGDTRSVLDDLSRGVRLAEHRGQRRPNAVGDTSGDAVIVEFGSGSSESIEAVVEALLVRNGRSSGEVGDGSGCSSNGYNGGRRSNAHGEKC